MDTRYIRSGTVISETIVVALNSDTSWFRPSGSILRTTCGMTMRQRICRSDMPQARPASRCPRGIDWMPARNVSA